MIEGQATSSEASGVFVVRRDVTTLAVTVAVADLADPRLRVEHRAALLALAVFRGSGAWHVVVPSDGLGRAIGVSARVAARVLRELVAFGYLCHVEGDAFRLELAALDLDEPPDVHAHRPAAGSMLSAPREAHPSASPAGSPLPPHPRERRS